MKDIPMGDILPGIVGKVERHQGGVPFNGVPPAIDDLPTMFPIGAQAYLLAKFRYFFGC
jgi:hypothetical protein